MNILGLIPARGGSKRLKNKNILPLLGRPLISYTIEHARESTLINKIVCSTESEEIARIAELEACEVVKRPKRLAQDRSHLEDVLEHTVCYLSHKCSYEAEIVVVLLANVPIRKQGIIDKVIQKLIDTKADSVFTAEPVGKYHPLWMVKRSRDDVMVHYNPSPIFRGQDLPPLYINNGAVWAVWSKVLKRKAKRETNYSKFGNDIRLVIQDRYDAVDVDDIYDFLLAETILKRGGKIFEDRIHR